MDNIIVCGQRQKFDVRVCSPYLSRKSNVKICEKYFRLTNDATLLKKKKFINLCFDALVQNHCNAI